MGFALAATFFPTPDPGEMLYSTIVRYHLQTAGSDVRRTMRAFFGVNTIGNLKSLLPSHLRYFFNVVGRLFWSTPTDIVVNQTLFPICGFFLPPTKTWAISAQMLGQPKAGGPMTISGLSAQGRHRGALRFCFKCREEDERRHGVGRWWCAHQVPGTTACWRHGLPLHEACSNCGELPILLHGLNTPPRACKCGARYLPGTPLPPADVLEAKIANQILVVKPEFIEPSIRRLAYHERLREKSIVVGEKLDLAKIEDEYRKFSRGENGAPSRRAWTQGLSDAEVVADLVSNKGTYRRSRFRCLEIRIIAWLFGDLHGFLDFAREVTRPTVHAPGLGSPPRRASETRETAVLEAIASGASLKAVCKSCGVSRFYPLFLLHRLGKPLPHRCRPIDEVRLEVILDCLRTGEPITQVARSLNFPYEEVLAASLAYNADVAEGKRKRIAEQLDAARHFIASLVDSGVVRTRSQLWEIAATQSDLLFRLDRQWFEVHAPPKRKARPRKKSSRQQVNWDALDLDISERLNKAYAKIATDPLHARVSKARLSRAVGFSNTWLHTHAEKMPKVTALLKRLVETGEESRARRVLAAKTILETNGDVATAMSVEALARVKPSRIKCLPSTCRGKSAATG
jgi:hypothetical protein